MKTYFVTGAGGFIGSKLSEKLAEQGNKVYALLYSYKEIDRLPKHDLIIPIIGDLSEYVQLVDKVRDGIDYFYHLAWVGISSAEYKNISIQKENIELTINSVSLAKMINASKYIFVGSNQEYLVSKDSKSGYISPASVYGICKRCSRLVAQTMCKDNMLFNSAAFTNVFGIGDYSKRTANFFINNLMRGKDLNLIEGNNLYDWVYIDDAINGLIAVGDNGVSGKQYYIGHKNLITFKEIIREVANIINPNAILNFGKYDDTTYTDYSNFDLLALYNDTGFECKTDFKESVLKTAEWVKSLNWEE